MLKLKCNQDSDTSTQEDAGLLEDLLPDSPGEEVLPPMGSN